MIRPARRHALEEPCDRSRGLDHRALVPMTGHTVNIEEPGLFNRLVSEFLTSVESDATERGRQHDRAE